MSAGRRIRDALCTLGVAVACSLVPLMCATSEVPDVEVRSLPWRTHGGRLSATRPTGQGFRCRWDGLRRIDVALVALAPGREAELELVLRAGGPQGALLRRARVRPGPLEGQGAFVTFEFDPLADSRGRRFWFELTPIERDQPSPYSAWVRFHGQPGHDCAWGDRILTGPVIEGPLVDLEKVWSQQDPGNVPHPHLRAVAVAADHLDGALGATRLELWEEGASGAPLRAVELGAEHEVHGGWAFFSFPPIADSRWKRYRFRFSLHEGARLVGLEQGLSLKTFHGGELPDSPLAGISLGGVPHADRDLVFRAWSAPSADDLTALIVERAGWKLVACAIAWTLAMGLVLRLLLARRARGAAPPTAGS
ncbi:MAG: hypothetical protein QGI46_10745 [Planctomycetota bacterium]|nr:hypothetical protein [Planctomycetota bacterium]